MFLQTKILTKIGGEKGNAQGAKIVEPLVHALITPKMLATISWSGRSGKGKEKKIPFSKYNNTINLITSICNKADSKYTSDECVKDIKYKILKYAQGKYGDDDGSNAGEPMIS